MWTVDNRARYNRDKLRYPSDLIPTALNDDSSIIKGRWYGAPGWRAAARETNKDTGGRWSIEDGSTLRAVGMTDQEWSLVEPLIPPAKRGGRKRKVVVREVVDGIMYVLSTGCQWRYVPQDLPAKSTLHDYMMRWLGDGTLNKLHHSLYVACREQIGRAASPTAGVIDSQSVKSAEKGGPDRPERV